MKAATMVFSFAVYSALLWGWGMRVGNNDAQVFIADAARSEKIAAIQCGRRGWVARQHATGEQRCVYINRDGSAITRTLLETPIGAM